VTTSEGGDGLLDSWAAVFAVINWVATAMSSRAQPSFSQFICLTHTPRSQIRPHPFKTLYDMAIFPDEGPGFSGAVPLFDSALAGIFV
jgi:hypothetical protein